MRFYLVNRNPYARNGRWTSRIEEKLRFYLVNRNPFARNGRCTSKTEEKLAASTTPPSLGGRGLDDGFPSPGAE